MGNSSIRIDYMSYKISVIIPVYNAEQYLERTINSIINQSIGFENIELIIVDDFSTDSSKEIIEKFSNKYSNIKPIYSNKNHSLPSFGRNKGIEVASSKYIMFSDHDDEYVFDFCETLYNEIENNDVDLVSCRYYAIRNNEIINEEYINNNREKKLVDNCLKCSSVMLWNKIFKKSIINKYDIKFPDARNEDYLFCGKYFANSKKLIEINYCGYKHYYYDATLGNTSNVKYEDTLTVINSYYDLCNYIIDNNQNPPDFFNKSIRKDAFAILCYPRVTNQSLDKIKLIFDKYISFEELVDGEKLNFVVELGKYFFKRKLYRLGLIYVKFLFRLQKSDLLKKVYVKI